MTRAQFASEIRKQTGLGGKTMEEIEALATLLDDSVTIPRATYHEMQKTIKHLEATQATQATLQRERTRAIALHAEGMARLRPVLASTLQRAMNGMIPGTDHAGCAKGRLVEILVTKYGRSREEFLSVVDSLEWVNNPEGASR